MTTTWEVFCRHGIKVLADGPELVLRGKVLPADILAYAREHKEEILAELRHRPGRANTREPSGSYDHRKIALVALKELELDAAIRRKVWLAAEREERNWHFLVREHGYPRDWFLLAHVDNWLRQHHRKGIATEGIGDEISAWWLCDAPLDIGRIVSKLQNPEQNGNNDTIRSLTKPETPRQGRLL